MLLDRLKQDTRAAHRQVERDLDLFRRAASPALYARVLARLLAFYAPLEDRLAASMAWDALGLPFGARRKAHLLRRDLSALGCPLPAEQCPDERLPALHGSGRALGCLYVLEGATLGGRIIARHFGQRFGLDAERGLAFHSAYGEACDERWRQFRDFALLQSRQASAADFDDEAVAGALATFAALSWWLTSAPGTLCAAPPQTFITAPASWRHTTGAVHAERS